MTVIGYHQGERAAQAFTGDTQRAEHLGRAIRETIPPVAAEFLAQRQLLCVAAADPGNPGGRIWATVVAGEPGFLAVPDERTVTVAAVPHPEDPLRAVLDGSAGPTQVGTIALEPATRRRMRVNGLLDGSRPGGAQLRAEEVFSNCPKYIQKRRPVPASPTTRPGPARRSAELTTAQRLRVGTADTFFVASAGPDGRADASHRGGFPGFVETLSPTTLRWCEYPGNGAYMTLGNIEVNPRTGLVLPDWQSGDLLLLTGEARTDWQQHAVTFTVAETVELPGALPMRWSEPEFSPANPPLG